MLGKQFPMLFNGRENQFCVKGLLALKSQRTGNISTISFILCCHMLSFFMNSVILFWPSKMLASLPCSDKFSWLGRLNMYARYARFPSQISSATNEAKSALRSWRNIESTSRTPHTGSTVFPRDSHRTSVWSRRLDCSEPSSSQSFENIPDWGGRALIVYNFDACRQDFRQRLPQMSSTSRRITQCVRIVFSTLSLIRRATVPECLPAIEAAPSAHTPTHRSHDSFDCEKKWRSTLKTSELVVGHCIGWENMKSSIISPAQQYRTQTNSCAVHGELKENSMALEKLRLNCPRSGSCSFIEQQCPTRSRSDVQRTASNAEYITFSPGRNGSRMTYLFKWRVTMDCE